MSKFLYKLVFLVIGIYLLTQMPFYKDLVGQIRIAFDEKVANVGEEVTRVKDKIDTAKDKIDQTKETITDITNKVKDTGEAVEDVFTSINKAHDTVDKVLNGENTDPETNSGGETVPEPQDEEEPESD